MIILGIDPGSHRIGYGLVAGGASPRLLESGVIEFKTETRGERLRRTRERVAALIRAHTPELIGIETLYFSKNVTTAMAVAEARGVILLAAAEAGVPVIECAPSAVKASATGSGNADKRAVTTMVKKLLGVSAIPGPDDAADALAIALAAETLFKGRGIRGEGREYQSPAH